MHPLTRGSTSVLRYRSHGVPELPALGRCLVMGVVNVTPDSFSDGARFLSPPRAIDHGLNLISDGADIVDVGGESTRPRAERVSEDEELRRVLPVVTELARAGATVSIDTMRSRVAAAAVEAGAALVNDVSGGLADSDMASVVSALAVPYVAMHWRGHSTGMHHRAKYRDVVTEVIDELRQRLEVLIDAGIAAERILLDPGIGFAKTAEHNWAVLAGLNRFLQLGQPILVGASRKSFLNSLMVETLGTESAPDERDSMTCAVSTLAAAAGVHCIRAHDVAATRQAIAVTQAWRRGHHA